MAQIVAPKGANTKKTIVGRGASSKGRTCGRGNNGQNSRSGGGVKPGFEGGQMPLYRRLPKRGFNNYNSKDIVTVSLARINDKFDDGAVVDVQALLDAKLIDHVGDGVKILSGDKGNEKLDLQKKFTVKANKFSASAKEKIENAGGTAEVIEK